MAKLSLLKKLGVYTQTNFLSPAESQELCRLMLDGDESETRIYNAENKIEYVDTELRKSVYVEVPKDVHANICERLLKLKPQLEQSFSQRFASLYEEPKYLIYRPGHFFGPHRDDQDYRRINITIFLNNPDNGKTFDGGDLIIYGLLKAPELKTRGITIDGQSGMLVAYPSALIHEVTPIVSGYRYAIVARFLAEEADSLPCEQGSNFQR